MTTSFFFFHYYNNNNNNMSLVGSMNGGSVTVGSINRGSVFLHGWHTEPVEEKLQGMTLASTLTAFERKLKVFEAPTIDEDLRDMIEHIQSNDKKEARKLKRTCKLMYKAYKQKIRDSIEIIYEEMLEEEQIETDAYMKKLEGKIEEKNEKKAKEEETRKRLVDFVSAFSTSKDK